MTDTWQLTLTLHANDDTYEAEIDVPVDLLWPKPVTSSNDGRQDFVMNQICAEVVGLLKEATEDGRR